MDFFTNNTILKLDNLKESYFALELPSLIFDILMMPIGIIGNAVVLYIYGFRLKKSPVNVFIIHLAVFDIMCSLIAIPLDVVYILFAVDYPHRILCKLKKFVIFYSCVASECTLLAIAMERYNKICRIYKFQLSLKHVKILVVAINILSVTMALPPALYYDRVKLTLGPSTIQVCTFTVPYVKVENYFIALLLMSFMNLVLILVLYILVWRTAKQRFMIKDLMCQTGGSILEKEKNCNQITRITASVTMLFAISYISSLLAVLTFPYWGYKMEPLAGTQVVMLICRMWILNCTLNPVVYGLLNDRFRFEVLNMLKRLLCMKKVLSNFSKMSMVVEPIQSSQEDASSGTKYTTRTSLSSGTEIEKEKGSVEKVP